ncbi:hypothetical protein GCM10010441_30150 [Kitasatospora paracochleata]|uniref:Uncharacterized protein n=1 Tax=Kitasatospora paracochleata TaxID=58354 RepID=A0ABT1IT73_9ACTN|nr:hypothetical protein [Kitasatospora paracochleata]MCP2308330.1 hypothetical protein [Kitasatospora paracochleata]
MAYEEDVARNLRAVAELAPDPPGEVLAMAGELRGRRRRARRRATVTGAVALVGTIALGATALSATGSADRQPPGGPRGRITGTYMSQTLRSLLPEGGISDEKGYGIGEMAMPDMGPTAWLQFDDGHGSVQVSLTTDRVDLPIGPDTGGTQCADPFETPIESCERTVRPDGSVLVITKELPRPPAPDRSWIAVFTGTDGRRVRLSERDYQPNGQSSGRTVLPLSPEQLTAVVASSAWDPLFEDFRRGATGRPTAPASPAPSLPSAQTLLPTLTQLLPVGATAGEPGPQQTSGGVHLPVTVDGRTSTVLVRVEPHLVKDHESAQDAFARLVGTDGVTPASPESDGTLSAVRVTGPSKGSQEPAMYWAGLALRPDGTLVSVSEVNASTWYGAQPGTPALTGEQLRAIAVSPLWGH